MDLQYKEVEVESGKVIKLPIVSRYGLLKVARDVFRSSGYNLVAVYVAFLISVALYVGVQIVAEIQRGSSAIVSIPVNGLSEATNLTIFIGAFTAAAIIQASIVALIGLTVSDGADGKVSAFRRVAPKLIRQLPHIVMACLFYALITYSVILIGMATILISAATEWSIGLAVIGPAVTFGGALVALYYQWRYLLIPVVALFEPTRSVIKLHRRTGAMIFADRSRFLVKLFLIGIVFGMLTLSIPGRENQPGVDPVFLFNATLQSIAYVFMQAMLVAFYLRQRQLEK